MKAIISFTVAALLFAAPAAVLGATWDLDVPHTKVQFKVKHLMITNVYGNFNTFTGTLTTDGDDISTGKLDVTIQVASIDTDNQKRDDRLRSPDFFDAATYPEMTFSSKKFVTKEDRVTQIIGDLTIRDVVREVTLEVEEQSPEVVGPWGKTRRGATATTTVNRFDYGLAWNKLMETGGLVVGEDIKIILEVQLIKR